MSNLKKLKYYVITLGSSANSSWTYPDNVVDKRKYCSLVYCAKMTSSRIPQNHTTAAESSKTHKTTSHQTSV